MSEQKKIHYTWIDLARALAILLVLLVHSVEATMTINLENIASLGHGMAAFLFLCYSAGRLGVPIFLMTSGFLLLDRTYTTEQCIGFWKKNWLSLFLITELWNVIYLLFLMLYQQKSYSLTDIILQLLFLKASDMNHLWYMPMILGWYLLLPFLANMLSQVDLKLLAFPMGILSFYSFIVPIANVFFFVHTQAGLTSFFLPGLYEGGFYGIYLILGFLVKRGAFRRFQSRSLAFTGVLCLAVTVCLQLYAYDRQYPYNTRYNLGLVAVYSVCVFELLSRYSGQRIPSPLMWLARYSFSIYLIHNIFRTIIRTRIDWIGFIPLRLAFLWGTTLLSSCLAAWLISRTQTGKWILLLRS